MRNMIRQSNRRSYGDHAQWPLLATALFGLSACAGGRPAVPAPVQFSAEVREILSTDRSSVDHYNELLRLEGMGPEVDAVLVNLVRDQDADILARTNALLLLADRQSTAALPVLRQVLLSANDEALRSAAVLGLQRVGADDGAAESLIRVAIGDPARKVRLNALQVLDIGDVETIRRMLSGETDRQVRQIAMQLVSLAEARGASLAPDRHGALRNTAAESEPQIVFRPARRGVGRGFMIGDLRIELPTGPDIPLSQSAEVVLGVVPAFISSDRNTVVFEAEREIRLLNVTTRQIRTLGSGIAPRLIPFTNQFVFLREAPDGRTQRPDGTEIRYEVLRASLEGGPAEPIGEIRAIAQPDVHANYSPVRWMIVGDTPEGFVLRGENMTTFQLPTPVWRPAESPPDSTTGA